MEVFPPVKITRAALLRMDRPGISPAFFQGKWTAVTFGQADCDQACSTRLARLDEAGAAQALLVFDEPVGHEQMRALQQRYPAIEIATGVTAASIDNFRAQFVGAVEEGHVHDYIFLITAEAELVQMLPATQLAVGDVDRELKAMQ